jgi:hypothetical protein
MEISKMSLKSPATCQIAKPLSPDCMMKLPFAAVSKRQCLSGVQVQMNRISPNDCKISSLGFGDCRYEATIIRYQSLFSSPSHRKAYCLELAAGNRVTPQEKEAVPIQRDTKQYLVSRELGCCPRIDGRHGRASLVDAA